MANIYDLSDTWNDGGTTFNAIKMNVTDTASAADSLLMDLQVGGASKFSVSKSGDVIAATKLNVLSSSYGMDSIGSGYLGFKSNSGSYGLAVAQTWVNIPSSGSLGFTSGDVKASRDTIILRDAANTLAQRNSTNAQTFNLYNTYTDASNYERGFMKWNSNVLEIGTEAAGTGTGRYVTIFGGGDASTPAYIIDQSGTYGRIRLFRTGINQKLTMFSGNNRSGLSASDCDLFLSSPSTRYIIMESGTRIVAFGDNEVVAFNAIIQADKNLIRQRNGSSLTVKGGAAYDGGSTNRNGGNLILQGGDPANSGARGQIIVQDIPTADPLVSGALWNDSGTLKISA